jgi:hypothetical protein
MQPIKLDLDSLSVDSFETEAAVSSDPAMMIAKQPVFDPFCCTGCVSGCGINPTAGGCASGGGSQLTIVVIAI